MTQLDLELKTMARAALRKHLAETPTNWEQRRYEIAKAMLPIIYAEPSTRDLSVEDMAYEAVRMADELIKVLKK